MQPSLTTLAILALLGSSVALAQTTTTVRPAPDADTSAKSGGREAVTRPSTDRPDVNNYQTANAATDAKLEEGSNSFTEAQVRKRVENAGYKDLKNLKKDDSGIRRGAAMLNGNVVHVGIDFKGNVAAQ